MSDIGGNADTFWRRGKECGRWIPLGYSTVYESFGKERLSMTSTYRVRSADRECESYLEGIDLHDIKMVYYYTYTCLFTTYLFIILYLPKRGMAKKWHLHLYIHISGIWWFLSLFELHLGINSPDRAFYSSHSSSIKALEFFLSSRSSSGN